MSRPPTAPATMITAGLLALSAGTTEVALRTAPRLALGWEDALVWLGTSTALALGQALLVALVLLSLRGPWRRLTGRQLPILGLVLASFLAVHGAMAWRLNVVLNHFLSSPVVWGGMLTVGALAVLLGVALDRPMRSGGRLLAGALLAVAVAATAMALVRSQGPGPGEPLDDQHPNILLVTLDTVRHDALEPYGGPVPTPAAARLAREGALFEEAIAPAPLTQPSHLAMLTGLAPHTTGFVTNGTHLGPKPEMISWLFQEAGYATGGFISGFPLHGTYGWAQGFHVYDDDFGRPRGVHRLSVVQLMEQVTRRGTPRRERRGGATTASALRWLESVRGGRWFLWLHLFDPHGPYEAPEPFAPTSRPPTEGAPLDLPFYWPPEHRAVTDLQWLIDAYHGEVRYTDHLVESVLDALDGWGILDDTAVVLVADHGESLTEHDLLFDHGDNLHDPSLRIPLLIRHPARVGPGVRVSCQVSAVDVASTILDLAGLEDSFERESRSLIPMTSESGCRARDVVATTVGGRFVADPPVDYALRARDRKYIHRAEEEDALYHLDTDPGETVNLMAVEEAEARALLSVLDGYLPAGGAIRSPSMDPATRDALRALGYLED